MSKSRGNVVDPVQKLQDFGSDEVKYVLLREGVPHSDCSKLIRLGIITHWQRVAPPPHSPESQFHAVFWKIWQNCMLAPSYENPGSFSHRIASELNDSFDARPTGTVDSFIYLFKDIFLTNYSVHYSPSVME